MTRYFQHAFILIFLLLLPSVLGGVEFFAAPVQLADQRVRFPDAGVHSDQLIVLYQEVIANSNEDGGRIFLRGMRSQDGKSWSQPQRLSAEIPYSSESPPTIYSAVFTNDEILLALSEADQRIALYRMRNADMTLERLGAVPGSEDLVAPRLFRRPDGGYLLFANRHRDFRIDIMLASSPDGVRWDDFRLFSEQPDLSLNFNPGYAHHNGEDVVVYQGLDPTVAGAYQLYLRSSEDAGQNWSAAARITDFGGGGNPPEAFDNQRPFLQQVSGQLLLAWERRQGNQTRQVFLGELDGSSGFLSSPEQVSTGFSNANAPKVLQHNDELAVVWLQSRSDGDRVLLAQRDGFDWPVRVINQNLPGSASFPVFRSFRDRLHVFWQNRRTESTGLAHLPPDQHVDPPQLSARNFPAGGRARISQAEVQIIPPDDPSGVVGYRYVWGGSPAPVVPTTADPDPREILQLPADRDGRWYLHVRARDAAGNWSQPATLSFERDTTPPPPVSFEPQDTDQDGFLTSNTFTVNWQPPDDPNIVGYSYRYQRVGSIAAGIPDDLPAGLQPPPTAINTRDTSFRRVNEDNGLWVLSVVAVDDVGNRSEPAYQFLPLNKYIPVTIVRLVDVQADAVGRMQITLSGRGFTADGRISRIAIEDVDTGNTVYEYRLADGDYRVVNDTTITGLTIARPLPGQYRILLEHPDRGIYRVPRLLEIDTSGTVKFGDFTVTYQPEWGVYAPSVGIILSYTSIWFWLLLLFLLIASIASGVQLVRITSEASAIRLEAAALLKGELMKLDAPAKVAAQRARKRGAGLRVKFTVFATLLVTSVVLMVAITLGSFVLDTQSRTLSQGLQDRVEVLLESIVTAAGGFLPAPEGNVPELNSLTNQIAVMPEAMHATITGRGREDASSFNYIWATNNPELVDGLVRGVTELEDDLSDAVVGMEERINTEARETLGDIAREIDNFTADIVRLALDDSPEAEQQRQDIDAVRSELETQLNQRLNEIGGGSRSRPQFDPDNLSSDQTEYVFYQPVLYRNPNEDIYFRGMVRMGVSTELILQEIEASQRTLILTTGIIALIAIGLGVVGALLLATIIIIPINRLVRGVEQIRITEDKRQLKGHEIQVKTRDELHVLAESVNLMTQGLVKAAEASEELTIGKEVQKMFIPLTQKDGKTKLSTGREVTDNYEFFGYYEGAKTVSGDYFTYTRLDPHTYGLIKCDVAGKGVSAALIMVEVATLFMNHFRDWNNPNLSGKALLQRRAQLRNLDGMLRSMNDLLEQTALAGRFAALTVGIFDLQNHQLTLANAGDNQVHLYRSRDRRTRQYEMPDAPAAGVFPSELIPNGYQPAVFSLEAGDMVLFFTDGLEEAKRILRDRDYRQKFEDDGVGDEEFSIDRIHRITEAIQSGGVYQLRRKDNPLPDEELLFDFSGMEPNAENTVLAMIAIEKIFRIYPDPQAGPDDRVVVDQVVDDFLKERFSAYSQYFSHPVEPARGGSEEYRQYAYIKEDEQYDDLTLLAIRRKQ
ncbi:SpoIIE family protein phosphatase [Spirochaeta africana]|uniref:HAMP domain-containing protein n=1 Tax=Spirochaeta africana (strain ATCC 700263 / DSM 8902 / Z-7692) TaxID=889378 RepID=H9UJQ1_SPIAZ|nr:SpoIIE family protein phosphatase [Spirochaeta africana]AFG37744.1 HAMP domain-containing protein [Spirochaeta africana DSM 8902]